MHIVNFKYMKSKFWKTFILGVALGGFTIASGSSIGLIKAKKNNRKDQEADSSVQDLGNKTNELDDVPDTLFV